MVQRGGNRFGNRFGNRGDDNRGWRTGRRLERRAQQCQGRERNFHATEARHRRAGKLGHWNFYPSSRHRVEVDASRDASLIRFITR